MNRKIILFSAAVLLAVGLTAQKSKTYKETFNIGDDVVLKINTTHTDIEFETWDKNQVEIVATVTLEDASEEDAQDYFEKDAFTIVGNSKEIEVSSRGRRSNSFVLADGDFDFDFDFDFEPLFLDLQIPDLPELAVIPELPPMPPMPSISIQGFDYGKYKEDGDEYLEEWKKAFEEGFGEEYQQKMKEWGERMKERTEQWKERNAEQLEERERRMEERAKEMEKRAEERAKLMEEHAEERTRLMEDRAREREERSFIISRGGDANAPNVFYFSSDGEGKKYKVKKTIKIKMPKSVKLKMNVKHGEVKLASTTKNINASLRYASLLASTIEGKNTHITASYSPVVVRNWNVGQLRTNYSDAVRLDEVGELTLNSISSKVVIKNLKNRAFLVNKLGELHINSIANGFSELDAVIQNGEMECKIPAAPFVIRVNESASDFTYPKILALGSSKNYDETIYKGYHINNTSGKSINIDSNFSQVVLKED